MTNNAINYWGLPFTSAQVFYTTTNSDFVSDVIVPGQPFTTDSSPVPFYMETAQPQFQTVEYEFWCPDYGHYDVYGTWYSADIMPGQNEFSASESDDNHLVVGVGNSLRVAG